ncbi:MAG: hypothetical protein IPI17_02550 [Nitrosomonas sp.]|nr:hypothetical protein [Nitrosomonas sp.]
MNLNRCLKETRQVEIQTPDDAESRSAAQRKRLGRNIRFRPEIKIGKTNEKSNDIQIRKRMLNNHENRKNIIPRHSGRERSGNQSYHTNHFDLRK